MLARVLEPEVMDTPDDARDYDAMDHSAVNATFVIDFRSVWDTSTPVLDVGTGTAQLPIELVRQHPLDDLQVVAIDLAGEMLQLARQNVERAGYSHLIRVEPVDAKRLPYPDRDFGAVISNSIIHHIPEPFGVFAEMHRVCEEGCRLFVRDLFRPPDEATLQHLVATYAAGCNAHQTQLFADSLRAALTVDEVRALVGRLGYAAETVHATSDRHWTFAAVRRA